MWLRLCRKNFFDCSWKERKQAKFWFIKAEKNSSTLFSLKETHFPWKVHHNLSRASWPTQTWKIFHMGIVTNVCSNPRTNHLLFLQWRHAKSETKIQFNKLQLPTLIVYQYIYLCSPLKKRHRGAVGSWELGFPRDSGSGDFWDESLERQALLQNSCSV